MALAAVDALAAHLQGRDVDGAERAALFGRLVTALRGETVEEGEARRLEERLASATCVWNEKEKAALRERFAEAVAERPHSKRRANQDYTNAMHLLRAEDWQALCGAVGLRDKFNVLMTFCHDVLDLRLPSELTMSMFTAICGSLVPSSTTWQQYQRLQEAKGVWRELSRRWARQGEEKGPLLLRLPKTWEELPESLQERLDRSAIMEADRWPVQERTIRDAFAGVPMRNTHASVKPGPCEGGGRGLQSSGGDLSGALRVLATVMNCNIGSGGGGWPSAARGDVPGLTNFQMLGPGQRGCGGAAAGTPAPPAAARAAPALCDGARVGESQRESQDNSQLDGVDGGAAEAEVQAGAEGNKKQARALAEQLGARRAGGGGGNGEQEEARAVKKRPAAKLAGAPSKKAAAAPPRGRAAGAGKGAKATEAGAAKDSREGGAPAAVAAEGDPSPPPAAKGGNRTVDNVPSGVLQSEELHPLVLRRGEDI